MTRNGKPFERYLVTARPVCPGSRLPTGRLIVLAPSPDEAAQRGALLIGVANDQRHRYAITAVLVPSPPPEAEPGPGLVSEPEPEPEPEYY